MNHFAERHAPERETTAEENPYSWQWNLASRFSGLSRQIGRADDGMDAIAAIAAAETAKGMAQHAYGLTFVANTTWRELSEASDGLAEILDFLVKQFPELADDFRCFGLVAQNGTPAKAAA